MNNTPQNPDREALAGLVFDTLFYPDMSPADCLDHCLSLAADLCSLIALETGEAAHKKSTGALDPDGLSAAAHLAGNLNKAGREIFNGIHWKKSFPSIAAKAQDKGRASA